MRWSAAARAITPGPFHSLVSAVLLPLPACSGRPERRGAGGAPAQVASHPRHLSHQTGRQGAHRGEASRPVLRASAAVLPFCCSCNPPPPPMQWRAPAVNETCCKRPKLAALLKDGAAGALGYAACLHPLPLLNSSSKPATCPPVVPPLPSLAVAAEGPDVLYAGRHAAPLVADIQGAGEGWVCGWAGGCRQGYALGWRRRPLPLAVFLDPPLPTPPAATACTPCRWHHYGS